MQITLFNNLIGENLVSMNRYANTLEAGLAKRPGINASSFAVRQTGFIKPFRPLLHFVPWLKDYGRDMFFSRYLKYPFLARNKQGQINHVTDQLNTHLLRILDPNKTVVTCHDLIPLEYEEDPIALKVFKWNIGFLSKAAKIIADSQSTKNDIIKFLNIPQEKITVVYLGVNPVFKPINDSTALSALRLKYNLPSGRFLLFVGNNLAYKNRTGLSASFNSLASSYPDLSLVIVGQPEPVAPALAGRVLYFSGLSESDLIGFYNLADVYVQPSLKQGFGWPVLEAMACGTPVVCSNTPSLPEVGGSVVIYADPQSNNSFAKGVSFALNLSDQQRDKIKEAGLAQAAKFSWEKCISGTVGVYNELISKDSLESQSNLPVIGN